MKTTVVTVGTLFVTVGMLFAQLLAQIPDGLRDTGTLVVVITLILTQLFQSRAERVAAARTSSAEYEERINSLVEKDTENQVKIARLEEAAKLRDEQDEKPTA